MAIQLSPRGTRGRESNETAGEDPTGERPAGARSGPVGAAEAGGADRRVGPAMLAALVLMSLTPPLATDMYLAALPRIAVDLHTSPSAVQATLTALLLGLAGGQLVIGPITDRLGRRMPLLIGVLATTAVGALVALAPSIQTLIVLRFAQGFFGAAGVVIARAVITDLTRGYATTKLMNVMTICMTLGPVIAPMLGGFLVDHIAWRGVLWVVAAFAAVTAAAAIAFVPESLPAERRSTGRLTAAFGAFPALLRNRRYVVFLTMAGLASGVMFAYISASPFVMQSMLGMSAVLYAVVFAANAIGMGLAGALAIRTARRWVPIRQMRTGAAALAVTSTGLLVAQLAGAFTAAPWLVVVLVLLAVSSLGLLQGNAAALAVDAGRRTAGAASALVGAVQFAVGAAASPLVGIAGQDTALPLAVVMIAGAVGLLVVARSRAAAAPVEA